MDSYALRNCSVCQTVLVPRFAPAFDWRDLKSLFAKKGSVKAFESALAQKIGLEDVLFLPRGRTAAYLLLKALPKKGEVVLPAYTCLTFPPAILEAGCRPVFVDNAPGTFSAGEAELISAVGKKTVAIIPTPMYGYPISLTALSAIRKQGIVVLLDAALALLLFLHEPSLKQSVDGALFAFGLGKEVSTLAGGALALQSAPLQAKIRKIWEREKRSTSCLTRLAFSLALPLSCLLFQPFFYPLLFALSEKTNLLEGAKGKEVSAHLPPAALQAPQPLQSALGIALLRRLDDFIDRRRQQVHLYFEGLQDLQSPIFQLPPRFDYPSFFPLRLAKREQLYRALLRKGFHTGTKVFDYVAAYHPSFSTSAHGKYPQAEKLSQEVLLLPLHHHLTKRDQERLIEAIRQNVRAW